jgi:exopolysaccharide biosynthesis protein
MPWGWVVIDGAERLARGFGPLASAVSIDAAGAVRWTHGDGALPSRGVVTAFQSYPTLLAGDGNVPAALRTGAGGLSLTHRDARLALGQDRTGRLLVVLTRFDAIGDLAGMVPLGPTTPEMAALLGALGASDAVLLDGGVSAQLLLRDARGGNVLRWPALRKVPLALIVRARRDTVPRASR